MLQILKTDSRAKALALSLVTAIALSACNSGGNSTSGSNTGPAKVGEYEVAGDHAIGNPDAAVTVVEYASVVCGACSNWHQTVYPEFKKKYIDTGKVRFVFREYPTEPANLARAGFLIANCAAEDRFFDNISLQFKRHATILRASDKRQEYINLAKAAGLSEAEFEACMSNEEENARLDQVERDGRDAGVGGTPAFFINGVQKPGMFLMEKFDAELTPLLGTEAPKEEEAPAETESSED